MSAYIYPPEIARRCDRTIRAIQRWAKQGLMPTPARVGIRGRLAWPRDVAEEWLRTHGFTADVVGAVAGPAPAASSDTPGDASEARAAG